MFRLKEGKKIYPKISKLLAKQENVIEELLKVIYECLLSKCISESIKLHKMQFIDLVAKISWYAHKMNWTSYSTMYFLPFCIAMVIIYKECFEDGEDGVSR